MEDKPSKIGCASIIREKEIVVVRVSGGKPGKRNGTSCCKKNHTTPETATAVIPNIKRTFPTRVPCASPSRAERSGTSANDDINSVKNAKTKSGIRNAAK